MKNLVFLLILLISFLQISAQIDCSENVIVHCNEIVFESTLDGSNEEYNYCVNNAIFEQSGNEQVFELHIPVNTMVHFVLTATPDPNLDLNLIILEDGCDLVSCVGENLSATIGGEDFMIMLDAGNYFLIVDSPGWNNISDNSDFTLSVDCMDILDVPECENENIPDIYCGQTVEGSLMIDSPPYYNVNSYCDFDNQNAFEDSYKLTLDVETEVQLELSSNDFDISLFVLNGCDLMDCFQASSSSGAEILNGWLPAGEYVIVIDGFTESANTPTGEYVLTLDCLNYNLDCTSFESISCGDVIQSDTGYPGFGFNNNLFWCVAGDYVGYEKTYSVNFQFATTAQIMLTNFNSINHDVFITSQCDPSDCLEDENGNDDYGANAGDEDFIFDFPAGSYFIHVDASNGSGSFELQLNCIEETLDCASAMSIEFGDTVFGSTSQNSATQSNVQYYCFPEIGPTDGFEEIYILVVEEESAIRIQCEDTKANVDPDVFILTDCGDLESCYTDPSGLIIYGANPGDEDFMTTLPPGTYYIIVDSFNGGGGYVLTLDGEIISSVQNVREGEIKIAPNPVWNTLQVDIPREFSDAYQLRIVSISGKEVMSFTSQALKHTIQTTTINSGMYMLILENEESKFVNRFVKI